MMEWNSGWQALIPRIMKLWPPALDLRDQVVTYINEKDPSFGSTSERVSEKCLILVLLK